MLLLNCDTKVKDAYVLGREFFIWVGYCLISDPLGVVGACTSVGVGFCSWMVVATAQVVLQAFWGSAIGGILVVEIFYAVGWGLPVGATKQVLLELLYSGLVSLIEQYSGCKLCLKKVHYIR